MAVSAGSSATNNNSSSTHNNSLSDNPGRMGEQQVQLATNPHVQELFGILKENDKDTAGLNALLAYVSQMEGFVKSATEQISGMKNQIEDMKEIQKHPIKTALQNTCNSLETRVTG